MVGFVLPAGLFGLDGLVSDARRRSYAVGCCQARPSYGAGSAPEGGGTRTSVVDAWAKKRNGGNAVVDVLDSVARYFVIIGAEKRGVPWQQLRAENAQRRPELERLEREVVDDSVEYPDYFLQPFHAYRSGNMGWLAADEVYPATLAIASRVYRQAIREGQFDVVGAHESMRTTVLDEIERYHGSAAVERLVDVGCSTGISSEYLARRFSHSSITAADLSPRFLAIGASRLQELGLQDRIQYIHANAEDLRRHVASDSTDLWSAGHLFHECPASATRAILREAHRVLRPGGTLCAVDGNPATFSTNAFVKKLHLHTEPFREEYSALDFREELAAAGFEDVDIVQVNSRHQAMLARKPTTTAPSWMAT